MKMRSLVFPKVIDKVEVVRSNQVRRAKLFCLRETQQQSYTPARSGAVRWLLLPAPAKSKPANPRDFPQF